MKRVRFNISTTDAPDVSIDAHRNISTDTRSDTSSDIRSSALNRQPVYHNCIGWYKHGCEKLIERKNQIKTIFPDKKYVSSLDIIEYVIYGEPAICEPLQVLFSMFLKDLITVENMIVNGKWGSFVSIPTYNSRNVVESFNNIHIIREVERLILGIKEEFYKTYLRGIETDFYNLLPQTPTVTYPRRSVKSDDSEGFAELVKDIIPYMLALEVYHFDLAKLLENITIDLRKIISSGIQ